MVRRHALQWKGGRTFSERAVGICMRRIGWDGFRGYEIFCDIATLQHQSECVLYESSVLYIYSLYLGIC